MGLRTQDPIPEWITHLALVENGRVRTGDKDRLLAEISDQKASTSPVSPIQVKVGAVVADLKNINVKYSTRVVCALAQ